MTTRMCEVEDCGFKHYARGWCLIHYNRWRKHGDPLIVKPSRWSGPANKPCTEKYCENIAIARGLCEKHYRRKWERTHIRSRDLERRKNPKKRKRGEGNLTKEGYIVLSGIDHPNASKNKKRIAEHTLVMSEMIGRPLYPWEIVHHKNGNRSDNRPENLELCTKYTHMKGQSVKDIVESYLPDYIKLYGWDSINALLEAINKE